MTTWPGSICRNGFGAMPSVSGPAPAAIHEAVTEATRCYLASRREKVRPFTKQHFGPRGALRLNRLALGKDLVRAPANVFWAGPYLLARGGSAVCRRLGLPGAATRLERLPPGFKTDVEKEVEWLIYSELLELPWTQGERRCLKDALFEEILAHPVISDLLTPELIRLDELAQQPAFRQRLADSLQVYTASRTAAAELAGTLLNVAAGVAAFQKLTPGTLALGNTAAATLAHSLAVSNFILGPTLGSLYYSLFPAAVPAGLLAGTLGGLMLAMGVIMAGAGVIADPVQQALGIHDRKLLKLIDALEAELLQTGKGYRLHDAYVARVFDLWDWLQTATRHLT